MSISDTIKGRFAPTPGFPDAVCVHSNNVIHTRTPRLCERWHAPYLHNTPPEACAVTVLEHCFLCDTRILYPLAYADLLFCNHSDFSRCMMSCTSFMRTTRQRPWLSLVVVSYWYEFHILYVWYKHLVCMLYVL